MPHSLNVVGLRSRLHTVIPFLVQQHRDLWKVDPARTRLMPARFVCDLRLAIDKIYG